MACCGCVSAVPASLFSSCRAIIRGDVVISGDQILCARENSAVNSFVLLFLPPRYESRDLSPAHVPFRPDREYAGSAPACCRLLVLASRHLTRTAISRSGADDAAQAQHNGGDKRLPGRRSPRRLPFGWLERRYQRPVRIIGGFGSLADVRSRSCG